MGTEKQLNKDILSITMKIGNEYPELSKYICEMAFKGASGSLNEISNIDLVDYYETLSCFLIKYIQNHKI